MFREGEWEEQSQQLKHDLIDHYGVIGCADLININPLPLLPFQEAHMITPSLSLKFIVEILSEGARVAPTTFRAFELIVTLTSIVNFQLVVELNLILHSEGARAPFSALIVGYRSSKISFHFRNNYRIFCERVKEQINNGDANVEQRQISHDDLISLAGFIGLSGISDLVGQISLIGCIGLDGIIGYNGLVGHIV